MKQLSLDTYRKRWQEYHLANGQVMDSRQINWRNVEWDQVIQIVTYLDGKKYLTHCRNPGFKFFVVYRNGGHVMVAPKQAKKIHEWAVGWSDGVNCFMTEFDFKTGELLRQQVIPVEKIKTLIHPKVRGRI